MFNYFKKIKAKKEAKKEAKKKAEFVRRLKMSPQERKDFDIGRVIVQSHF